LGVCGARTAGAAEAADATTQTSESALESTRKTAETAMSMSERSANRSAESAKAAIDAAQTSMKVTEDSAKEAIDTIKEIYATVGIIAGIVVALAAFFGFREYKQLRKGGQAMIQSALDQAKAEFARKLDEEIEKLKTTGLTRIHAATLISLDTTDVVRNLRDYNQSSDPDEKQAIRQGMIEQFKDLEENARALDNKRTLSWVWAQRALMSYYEGDLEEAYRYQTMAVGSNSLHRADRHYNLAAIAARLYSLHPNRSELLNEAVKELGVVLKIGSRLDARNALRDDDLSVVFKTHAPLKRDFEQRAGLPVDDGTG
jgi:hypothetical protein